MLCELLRTASPMLDMRVELSGRSPRVRHRTAASDDRLSVRRVAVSMWRSQWVAARLRAAHLAVRRADSAQRQPRRDAGDASGRVADSVGLGGADAKDLGALLR